MPKKRSSVKHPLTLYTIPDASRDYSLVQISNESYGINIPKYTRRMKIMARHPPFAYVKPVIVTFYGLLEQRFEFLEHTVSMKHIIKAYNDYMPRELRFDPDTIHFIDLATGQRMIDITQRMTGYVHIHTKHVT
jgi:hypothetical protein